MFVRNRTKVQFRVSVRGKKVVLEPNTVTHIEDGLISEKQLRDIYGHRIDIINEDGTSTRKPVVKEEPVKLTERKEDLTDATLESILKEVSDELEAETNKEMSEQEIQEALEDIQDVKKDEIVNDENSDVIIVPTAKIPVVEEVTPSIAPEVTPTVPEVPVKVTRKRRTSTGKTRTKRASKKKQD